MTQPLKGLGTPPAVAPSNLTISRLSGTSLKLMWDPSIDYYHRVYRVYRSNDNFATETIVKTTKINQFEDRNLPIDTWYYRVIDVDKFDIKSDASSIISYEITELLPFTDTFDVTTGTGVITQDINDSLGRNVIEGTISNEGPETVTVELSYDGSTFPKSFEMARFDVFNIADRKDRISIDSMRFTSTDSKITLVAS